MDTLPCYATILSSRAGVSTALSESVGKEAKRRELLVFVPKKGMALKLRDMGLEVLPLLLVTFSWKVIRLMCETLLLNSLTTKLVRMGDGMVDTALLVLLLRWS